jgi:hypothetical protein
VSSFIFVQVAREALGEQAHKVPVVLGVREVVPSSTTTFQKLQVLPRGSQDSKFVYDVEK